MREENRYDKIKRIVESKLVDRIDKDYTELSEEAFGKAYSSDVARRMFYGAKKVIDAIEEDKGRVNEDETRILCISDMHIPFNRDIKEFFKYKGKVDTLVLNGDIIDNYSMSSFTKMYRLSLVEELIQARKLLIELIEEIKPKKVTVVTGNHEIRLGKKIADKIGSDLLDLMPRDALAFLFDTGFNYYDRIKKCKTVYTPIDEEVDCEINYVGNFWAKEGKTIFVHPQAFRGTTLGTVGKAYDYFTAIGEDFQSIIMAHTHKLGMYVMNDKYLYEQGTCANLNHMDYQDLKLPKSSQVNGYMYIIQDKDGNLIYDKTKLIRF